jgi:hypothetical protein
MVLAAHTARVARTVAVTKLKTLRLYKFNICYNRSAPPSSGLAA